MTRRFISFALILVFIIFTGCSFTMPKIGEGLKWQAAASFYPIFTIAANIIRDVPDVTLTCLIQPQDGCLRSYELSSWDEALLLSADAMIIGGRGLESFEGAIMGLGDAPLLITAMNGLTLINQGAQTIDEDANHSLSENPWLFLSTRGAEDMASIIAEALSMIDPAHADLYYENLSDFRGRLALARREIAAALEPAQRVNIALMHEGLCYFTDEWGLNAGLYINREPGTYFEDAELNDVIAMLESADIELILLELQAPMRLTEDLEGAGYRIALMDTLSAGTPDGNLYAYEQIMIKNAHAIRGALVNP
jgi:zinc transport system substrate-binding protein